MIIHTRSDAVHLEYASAEAGALRSVGTLPGVVIQAVAQRNGLGAGRLIAGMDASGTPTVSWQAPGSATPGAACTCSAAIAYLIEDGEDVSKWVRIVAYPGFLATSGEARVYLKDGYTALGPTDVSAAAAAAGLVTVTTYQLKSYSYFPISNVRLWIDPAAAGLEVSSDAGATYWTPTSELDANVLVWSTMAAGASVDVTVRRTITAGAASSAGILNHLRFAWTGF